LSFNYFRKSAGKVQEVKPGPEHFPKHFDFRHPSWRKAKLHLLTKTVKPRRRRVHDRIWISSKQTRVITTIWSMPEEFRICSLRPNPALVIQSTSARILAARTGHGSVDFGGLDLNSIGPDLPFSI